MPSWQAGFTASIRASTRSAAPTCRPAVAGWRLCWPAAKAPSCPTHPRRRSTVSRSTAASRIDVTVTRLSSLTRPGIRVHRHPGLIPADLTVLDGIPVTSLSRTLLGFASFLREPALERACDQAVVNGDFDMREMENLLRQLPRPPRRAPPTQRAGPRRPRRERPGERPRGPLPRPLRAGRTAEARDQPLPPARRRVPPGRLPLARASAS